MWLLPLAVDRFFEQKVVRSLVDRKRSSLSIGELVIVAVPVLYLQFQRCAVLDFVLFDCKTVVQFVLAIVKRLVELEIAEISRSVRCRSFVNSERFRIRI